VNSDQIRFPVKVVLVLRIWYWYVRVRIRVRVRQGNLAELVDWLGSGNRVGRVGISPRRLGGIVGKALPFRYSGATCLLKSLVLFRLLQQSGLKPELVVGLARQPTNHDAHAWTEIDGVDVGPPPGRAGHVELARYRAGKPPAAPAF
jgi:hypothetical protein